MIDAYFFKIFIKAKRPILPLKKVVILRSGRHRTLDIGHWRSDTFQVANFPPPFFLDIHVGKRRRGKFL